MGQHPLAGSAFTALLQSEENGRPRWLGFRSPRSQLRAERIEEVIPVLAAAERAAEDGMWAVGFLSYEAARAFDPAHTTRDGGDLPLAWFGLFDSCEQLNMLPATDRRFGFSSWRPSISEDTYRRRVARIRRLIAAGDTYQVNFTFRLRSLFEGDPLALLHQLAGHSQGPRHCAYIDLGEDVICSGSPELFFNLDGSRVLCRPMKGTVRRGRTSDEDHELAAWLERSGKNRAENVMIVDMVRNDLGRIARAGTVSTSRLLEVERYETLFQLTSTVAAETDSSPAAVLAALFPCASITGAPKIRTEQLIAELEGTPRGIYTGAIGYLAPDRRAAFNVAIRTVHIDRRTSVAEYGTGGGIVWDSRADDEYRECRTKALAVTARRPTFELLESLLWTPSKGHFLLERHLDRLADSAAYFGFPRDRDHLRSELEGAAAAYGRHARKVRLLLASDGSIDIHSRQLDLVDEPWRVGLAPAAIDRADPFLFHKTTRRHVYERALRNRPDLDDVLLWNAAGELTESTLANLVVVLDGIWCTPPVAAGLLAGTFRAELLERGRIVERAMPAADIGAADEIYLINSVRRWISVQICDAPAEPLGRGEGQAGAEQSGEDEKRQADEEQRQDHQRR